MLQRPKMTATVLSVSVLTLFLVGLSPLPQLLAATTTSSSGAGATLNPVQISIQTKNLTSVSSYDLVAYNSTGAPVASYTGQYSRFTFDLPSGTYLFAATANGPAQAYPTICYGKGVTGSGVASPPAQTSAPSSGANSAIAYPPCGYSNPLQEYGYSLTQVSGSSAVTISTQSPSVFPTTNVSVSVSYKNGTAVSDASVSANVVGANWYWGDSSRVTMYAQTAADGIAHLVVPSVPLAVSASKSVQVTLPKGQTTTQVTVGGQTVNVTIYYSPSYVYESATALLIPPQASLSMVMTAQTGYPIIPYGVGATASGAPTSAGGLSTSPIQGQTASQAATTAQGNGASSPTPALTSIPPIPASDVGAPATSTTQPSSSTPSVSLLAIGTLALVGAIAAIVGIAIKSRR
jgi:hypothetical protein